MRGCRIALNHDALHHNLKRVKKLAPRSRVVAMVKANAYGHGLIQLAKALDSNVEYFGVACLSEAIRLRQAGCQSKILLVEGFFSKDELQEIIRHRLSIVLHQPWQVEAFLALKTKIAIDVWVKHDSGMHRLGLNTEQFKKALAQLKRCPWAEADIKLMTHFACSDHIDQNHMKKQHQTFKQLIADYAFFSVSAANSAAVLSFPDSHYQYVRPGLMLYGSSPFSEQSARELDLKPVMTFSSKIIALRHCQVGEFVGYGATWQATQPTMIATVAAGYGDGYPWQLSKEAYVLIDNTKCPIIGRVSMDMLSVDVTQLNSPHIDQEVILWGDKLPVETVASFSNTISYDLLCRVGLQAHR